MQGFINMQVQLKLRDTYLIYNMHPNCRHFACEIYMFCRFDEIVDDFGNK